MAQENTQGVLSPPPPCSRKGVKKCQFSALRHLVRWRFANFGDHPFTVFPYYAFWIRCPLTFYHLTFSALFFFSLFWLKIIVFPLFEVSFFYRHLLFWLDLSLFSRWMFMLLLRLLISYPIYITYSLPFWYVNRQPVGFLSLLAIKWPFKFFYS